MEIARIKAAIIQDSLNQTFTQAGWEPLFSAPTSARIVIVGQAPGRLAQESRLFWNDPSGDRLRAWLGIDREAFYNSPYLAHLPMDFYYPGKGKSGDLPPRKGFAAQWHPLLLAEMPEVELILLVGNYAQKAYLASLREKNLTETVRHYQKYLPTYFPLVHPSPLNHRWLRLNPWFEAEVVPVLQARVASILNQ